MGMLGRLRKNLTVGAANTLYKSLIVRLLIIVIVFGPAVTSVTQTA